MIKNDTESGHTNRPSTRTNINDSFGEISANDSPTSEKENFISDRTCKEAQKGKNKSRWTYRCLNSYVSKTIIDLFTLSKPKVPNFYKFQGYEGYSTIYTCLFTLFLIFSTISILLWFIKQTNTI